MHYKTTILEAPVALDLLTELKLHIRTENETAEDTTLQQFLESAALSFEHETNGRVVLDTTFQQDCPTWDIELEKLELLELLTVSYYDSDDELVELDPYHATTAPEGYATDGEIVYLPSGSYPALSDKRPRPITITYRAGWSDVDYLPKDVVVAITQAAAFLYLNRESHSDTIYQAIPQGFSRITNKYHTGRGL